MGFLLTIVHQYSQGHTNKRQAKQQVKPSANLPQYMIPGRTNPEGSKIWGKAKGNIKQPKKPSFV